MSDGISVEKKRLDRFLTDETIEFKNFNSQRGSEKGTIVHNERRICKH